MGWMFKYEATQFVDFEKTLLSILHAIGFKGASATGYMGTEGYILNQHR
jgi:hypothetical protein